jgi:Replication Fork Protection Component Swi3
LLGAAAAARQKQKRPKLTYEDLKKSSGLPEIYHNFPTVFKSNFRGKGHELSDLRRLLEMYKRWQDRVFAHGSFDNFIATVEKIGAANIVKKDMSDMRMDLLKTVEDALASEAPAEEEQGAAAGRDDDGGMFTFGGAEDTYGIATAEEEEVELALDSDEELLELAAAPMGAEEQLAAAAQAAVVGGDVDMDDEELLELAMQGNGNNNISGDADAPDEIDDDELLELAMQG